MTTKSTKWLVLAGLVLAVGAFVVACNNNFFFLRGTLHGDCDPPRGSNTDTTQIQTSNCQVGSAVCCRTSVFTPRTSCEYPEDCYIAPYLGKCATAVDCVDSETCMDGTCQCTQGGPACTNPVTKITVCCTAGELCDPVQFLCATPDGGIVMPDLARAGEPPPPDLRVVLPPDLAQ